MQCVFHANANDFFAACEGALLLQESENSLMLGLLDRILAGTLETESPIYASVSDGGTFVGHALRTNLDTPLDLAAMPEDAVATLVNALHARDLTFRSALGVTTVSACFAERWTAAAGVRSELSMRQGIYELREVIMPPVDDGVMVRATTADRAEVEPFVEGFNRDIGDDTVAPAKAAREMAERHLNAGTLYLWKSADGQLVSIAAKNRETRNGATISLVYTPPEHRRRGYAGRLVASLSQHLLNGGKTLCNLYTDLSNPTSNGVYQRIGYTQIAESRIYEFDSGVET